IKIEQIRTGDTKKVSHHQVGVPDRLKFRETVENVESLPAFLCNFFVNRHGEGFKPCVGIKRTYLDSGGIFEDRFMLGKPDINYASSVTDRLTGERFGKHTKFINGRNLPDNVISKANMIKDFIQLRMTAENFVKGCHNVPPFWFHILELFLEQTSAEQKG